MDFFQNPKYKPATREELVKMKKYEEEKEINNIIEKIVKHFCYPCASYLYEFNVTQLYLIVCNLEKKHELLNSDLLKEADDTSGGDYYINMANKFIDDNEDKIITKLLYNFPDCNFEIVNREVVKLQFYHIPDNSIHNSRRKINAKIIIMRWDDIKERSATFLTVGAGVLSGLIGVPFVCFIRHYGELRPLVIVAYYYLYDYIVSMILSITIALIKSNPLIP